MDAVLASASAAELCPGSAAGPSVFGICSAAAASQVQICRAHDERRQDRTVCREQEPDRNYNAATLNDNAATRCGDR